MKLPDLLRREKRGGPAAPVAAPDGAERLLAEAFRALSRLCSGMADLLETRRLQRRGYESQGKWLERLEKGETSTRKR